MKILINGGVLFLLKRRSRGLPSLRFKCHDIRILTLSDLIDSKSGSFDNDEDGDKEQKPFKR